MLPNRAIAETYPPGSTFKLIDTAAALQNGFTPDSQLTAGVGDHAAGHRDARWRTSPAPPCGTGPTASLRDALARSCNTAFAELGAQLGEDKIRAQAEAFGVGTAAPAIPMTVAPSTLGDIPDTASLQQSAIGQRDVRFTPLQNAMIVAAIANGGQVMAPHLVAAGPQARRWTCSTRPSRTGSAGRCPRTSRTTLTDLMIGSENRTQGGGKITGVQIAAKTGTAEHGADPKATPPHDWYVAFAPANDPQIAVAVLVENGGDRSLEATGGVAGPRPGSGAIGESSAAAPCGPGRRP